MSSENVPIFLKSSDGESFEVEQAVAVESQTIKHMIEDGCADNAIPLPNVTSNILSKVIEYCKKHVDNNRGEDNKVSEEDLKAFDADFVKVDQGTLFDLILMAFTFVVYPSLILAYMGQAAYLSKHHILETDYRIGFYVSVPEKIRWPVLGIVILAAVVGSQAILTGTFSTFKQCLTVHCFSNNNSMFLYRFGSYYSDVSDDLPNVTCNGYMLAIIW